MKVWSLRWNTLNNRSILPEILCQGKTQPPSKTEQKTSDLAKELYNTVAVGCLVRCTCARYFNRVWRWTSKKKFGGLEQGRTKEILNPGKY